MYANPYNPYFPPYSNPIPGPVMNPAIPQMNGPQMEIQKVNGEESARAFPMGPNSSAILLDTVQPLIWVVTTDASGYKNINPFSIAPYVPEEPVSADDLKIQMTEIVSRLDKIEERINSYGQSNYGTAWKGKPGNANTGSNVRNGQSSQGSSGGNTANIPE